jgi:4-diphosphocytidyl-2-C-methyl-D-erythritol kinase
VIAEAIAAMRGLRDCRLARMSGSGSTCFGLFASAPAAMLAAESVLAKYPHWWVRATSLGGAK